MEQITITREEFQDVAGEAIDESINNVKDKADLSSLMLISLVVCLVCSCLENKLFGKKEEGKADA